MYKKFNSHGAAHYLPQQLSKFRTLVTEALINEGISKSVAEVYVKSINATWSRIRSDDPKVMYISLTLSGFEDNGQKYSESFDILEDNDDTLVRILMYRILQKISHTREVLY